MATYDTADLRPIKLAWGVPAIWNHNGDVIIADYKFVYVFRKINIFGLDGSHYLMICKDSFLEYPNRIELEEMNGHVCLYACYNKGVLLRGILDHDNLQWSFTVL